jgi:glycerate-2-kinase
VRSAVLASNATALDAAARAARDAGLDVRVVSRALAGEARDAGRRLAALARSLRASQPTLLLAGGETTVTVRGDGRGGRSQELALAAALELAGCRDVALLAAGTDGSDGPTDAAGAFADGGSVERGRARGWNAGDALARNDSHGFFAAEGGLLRTGPTHTNVLDLVLVAVGAGAPRSNSGLGSAVPCV